jgi:hypothetical protein
MNKTYIIAGTSRKNGKLKVQYSNNLHREKVLEGFGHTDINMVVLSEPMTKYEVIIALLHDRNFSDNEAQAALNWELKYVNCYEIRHVNKGSYDLELF